MEGAVHINPEPSDANDLLACTPQPTKPEVEALSIKTEAKREPSADSLEDAASSPDPDPVEPLRDQHQQQQQEQEPDALGQWAKQTSVKILEHGVNLGMDVLETIKFPLTAAASIPGTSTQASTWLDAITQLESRGQPFRAIVGVVGNTGTGKSSVINALLDEERLLPTNCSRACTASPTEISYNRSDDPDELYRADIEFITAEDWIKELNIIFTELLDRSGNVSRECNNPDTEAGIAYAKMKAVYPSKSNQTIAESNPERLALEPAVRGVLGSVKKLRSSTAKRLYNAMRRYVDSKDKDNHIQKNVDMEYWPLIKVVRIYIKADALSTGAVIVDLPGVQDSNAGRAAVAQQYMKACTGLWIVAPINRAVDDKTAKSLLGDSFKRQLKYDGIYSAVTFICSKTDEISVSEASENLNIESDVSESWAKMDDLRRQINALNRQFTSAREEKAELVHRLDQLDCKWEIWDELSQEHTDGKTIYPPPENAKKRKRGATSAKSRKNCVSSDFEDGYSDSASESGSDEENQPEDKDREPLSGGQIREVLAGLKAERKKFRQMRKKLDAKLSGARDELKSLQYEERRLHGDVKHICIQGRNDSSKGAIQREFAMGIKE